MISVNDTCNVTGLSRKTIYRKMESGELPYIQQGRKRLVSEADALALRPIPKSVSNDTKCHCVELRATIESLTQEMTQLKNEVRHLTQAMTSMSKPKEQAPKTKQENAPSGQQNANDERARIAKEKLFAALYEMDEIPIYRGKPSITGIHKATGIDRGTISKYIDEWEPKAKS
ncbi:helix-turn-helix domain-containing protein [Photobacterium satsumensis]|uniref:helix-turn-helix domain-containing protein n=1 Tax=Photobacterium satsumensis TaxID=2910239 RepID=UPI003D0C05F3